MDSQSENKYTGTPNTIVDALMKINLTSYQSRIIRAIERQTFGWHKKEDWISNSQLVQLTGLRKNHASRTIKELKQRHIIIQSGKKISINSDCSQWQNEGTKVTSLGHKVTSLGNKKLPDEGPTKESIKETLQKKEKHSLSLPSLPQGEDKGKEGVCETSENEILSASEARDSEVRRGSSFLAQVVETHSPPTPQGESSGSEFSESGILPASEAKTGSQVRRGSPRSFLTYSPPTPQGESSSGIKNYSGGILSVPKAEADSEARRGNPPAAQLDNRLVLLGQFEQFWDVWPRKRNKGDAEEIWLEIQPGEQLLKIMIQVIEKAKKTEEWQRNGGRYIPYPAKWLKARGWEDSIEITEERTQKEKEEHTQREKTEAELKSGFYNFLCKEIPLTEEEIKSDPNLDSIDLECLNGPLKDRWLTRYAWSIRQKRAKELDLPSFEEWKAQYGKEI